MIDVHVGDHVRTIRLSVPQRRNALSRTLVEKLTEAFDRPVTPVHVTVLTGARDHFSAGADLADLEGTDADVVYDAAIADLRRAVESCNHATLAAIDGYCLGAAVDLVTAFDLVVAHRDATFAIPATRLGLLYDPAALQRMAGRVRLGGLAHLLLTGDRIGAEQAHDVGLVDIVSDEPASRTASDLAARIAMNDPDAVSATAHVLRDIRQERLDTTAWMSRRLDLMNSPARSRALAAARRPKRVAP